MRRLFCDGLVFNSRNKTFERRDILVNDSVIEQIEEEVDILLADEIVDCAGKYLIPGLVDVHTHGRSGFDFNLAGEADILKMRRDYAASGTTTLLATLASAPLDSLYESIDSINANRENNPSYASIAGVHLEGRYLSEKRRGAHASELLKEPDAEELGLLAEAMLPAPFHVSAALELAPDSFYDAVISRGGTLGIAHSDATYEEAMAALSKGAVSFTHTFNAMRPIHHREPGNVTAALLSDAYAEIICDGEHVHPAMIEMLSRLKPENKVVLITDSMEATGCADGEYAIAGQKVFVKDGKAVNVDGALAGSTLNMLTALKNYMSFCSLTLEKALNAATLNPANMVGISHLCGSLKTGKRADIILLDDKDKLDVFAVYAAGGKAN